MAADRSTLDDFSFQPRQTKKDRGYISAAFIACIQLNLCLFLNLNHHQQIQANQTVDNQSIYRALK